MADHRQHRTVTVGHVVLSAVLGVAFTALGVCGVMQAVALQRSKSVAVARVVESRMMTTRRGGVSYEIRYRFSPAPGSPEIGRSDFLGRSNLWSPLPEADWQAATATNRLSVRFDSSQPGNNAPDVAVPGSLGDSSTLLCLGIGLGVAAVCGEIFRRRQALPAPKIGGSI